MVKTFKFMEFLFLEYALIRGNTQIKNKNAHAPPTQKTKTTSEKNSCLDEGWPFIGSFTVASVPRIINKEVLTQFIHKPACINN